MKVTRDLAPLTPAVLHILLALSKQPRHGYGIMKQVESDSQGKVKMGPGTLYGSLKRMLEAGFYEQYDEEVQPVGEGISRSSAKYGAGGLRPAWEPTPETKSSPLWRYPMSQVRDTLERLAAEENGSPFDGVMVEYTHPLSGGSAMPTIACSSRSSVRRKRSSPAASGK